MQTHFERLENAFSIEHMLGVLSILHLLSQSDGWPLTPAEVRPMDRREIELCVSIDDYVNNHIDTPIDIKLVAARVHMSTASFCRFFRRYFGMSFHAWLLDKKIETASLPAARRYGADPGHCRPAGIPLGVALLDDVQAPHGHHARRIPPHGPPGCPAAVGCQDRERRRAAEAARCGGEKSSLERARRQSCFRFMASGLPIRP